MSLEIRRPISHISPVGAGVTAKQATRCLAPASPVFAGKPAPTGSVLVLGNAQAHQSHIPCGSGRDREAGNAVFGTGFAGVRGQARSYRGCVAFGNAQAHQSWAKRISRVCPINNGAFASVTPRM
ncbi:hypothetical protein FGL97_02330 [Pseudomonas putida]|nr:hypothetical protein [Pseudomonas putida]NVN67081.1 hypothetical protein [Pseudomonas putida]